MKRWTLLFAAVVLAGLFMKLEPAGTDVAKLEPVEVIYIDREAGVYVVLTDTGSQGRGTTAAEAMAHLEQTAQGRILPEMAEYLLVSRDAWESISRFFRYLRPDCSVTIVQGKPDLEKTGRFLDAHRPDFTLNDFRAGGDDVPVLHVREGGMILEKP